VETPQSVSVITRDQLAARGGDRLSETLRYTPGAQGETFGFEPRTAFLRSRGFDATQSGLFRNGGLQLRNPRRLRLGTAPSPMALSAWRYRRGRLLYCTGRVVPVGSSASSRSDSQGIEVEGTASLTAGLDLTASYTRQDVEITESVAEAKVGERPVQVREQMGTV